MKTFVFSTLFMAFAGFATSASEVDSWIVAPPDIAGANTTAIPPGDVFEVVASMCGNAGAELQKKTFVALSEKSAKHFTGTYYSCPKGKKPYLVRGVYGFAGTGAFFVSKIGTAVWVSHRSLGDDFTSTRTALILNLDFEPTAVYSFVSIIR
jgi:hypothetical protein